ncbi:hypothetical protein GOP47_0023382 [Adiantum capillus-veneris]|uniref:GDSL esterase/lipase n=1 Tax=Adiantum capillus-veneris TaxID=13818 RepID=A0A9D4Z529_ADICA|nr:hypothetical protein GOP47_0023382 [Adiantum capillus-veneris]
MQLGGKVQQEWPTVCTAATVAVVIGLLWQCAAAVLVHEEKPVPAIFALGDSLLDAGNNNGLRTLAKANHPPYGLDFPTHTPTGRFVNGYMILDYLALKLGLPLIPIHSDPSTKGAKLLYGVNFASAASGIQAYTGHELGKVYSLDVQIQQFAEVKKEIIATIGANATSRLISKALFYIVTGTNDWLLYLGTPVGKLYTKPQYRDLLITKFNSQIKELYNMGAQRVVVVGLGAFGCCPGQLRAFKAINGTCVASVNKLAKDFNAPWRSQFLALADTLPGAQFAFQDACTALLHVRNNPSAYGYSIVDHACCGIGKYQGFPFCFQGFPVCDNVESHLFWDAYHPTSRFQEQFLDLVWNNGPPYSYPYSSKEFLMGLKD